MLFPYLLKKMMEKGSLRLLTADGRCRAYGQGSPQVTVKLHRKSLEWSLGLWPELKIGEAYMRGDLTVEEGSLGDFLAILMTNYNRVYRRPLFRWIEYLTGRAAMLPQFNPLGRAKKNAAHHYNLPDRLYEFFLDSDLQYSCAYFTDPGNSLEQAQADKKLHIASKLLLDRPGLNILDIGSGWGGMGLYLARQARCNVTGLTLSIKQYKKSRARARAAGLDQLCTFKLKDYRQETGTYDRIVSVGMFEHVGKKNYAEFFERIHQLLADDGVCLLHTISRFNPPQQTGGFIRKYIFPGGDIPALSEITDIVQRSGLIVTDIEILRLHYAETLKHWTRRFTARSDEVIALYGEAFYRMWFFYLVASEMSFRHNNLMVAQIQLSKNLTAVPLTRDYMHAWETRHRESDVLVDEKIS